MKKITLSAALIAAMSTLAIAGGDIAPVEPVVEPIVEESTGAFYLGLAYSYMSASSDVTGTGAIFDANGNLWNVSTNASLVDDSVSSAMLQAGYKFNDYVAIEGRYWFGGTTDQVLVPAFGAGSIATADVDVDSWGIYVKPMYPVTEAFNIYALLGYASSSYDVNVYQGIYTASLSNGTDFDGFSWGLGADYAFGENWSVFVDYTLLYDDTTTGAFGIIEVEDTLDSWNFGVTYTF
ncbi:MAG: outer membrane beta-barrel protein [Sulfurovum sp.]|nr:outer membrane beta-barrel protein [Sulfurovum sp.]